MEQTNGRMLAAMTCEEIIREAEKREASLLDFYSRATCDIGPDAQCLFVRLLRQHRENVDALEKVLHEIEELRELAGPIAD